MRFLVRKVFFLLSLMTAAFLLSSCLTVSDKQAITPNTNAKQLLNGKKIAVLPVKTQTSLAPDSVLALRTEVNKNLSQAVRDKLQGATVVDMATVADLLNRTNSLSVFEQLVTSYETTGVLDRQKIGTLGRALSSDFLLLPRLKAEKLDILIQQGIGASLELQLVNAATGEIAWAGSGEWKRGGLFGLGRATSEEVVSNLISLALSSL